MQDNLPELTVSELSQAVKRTVEDAFSYVRVRGEISGWRGPHNSGHCYFALKDEGARIDAIIWRGTYQKLKIPPEEGMEVIAVGRVSTYPGRSTYQIIIERIEPAGVGALMALLEERRLKLAAEGLFDEARKRRLPYLPRVIGVVTSPTGAVIRDVLHRLDDRFPTDVLVWPVRVQGDGAAAEIAAGIHGFNAAKPGGVVPRPDVIIVARGGGSLEDLWCFNEEIVVRAAASSEIPLISAVGHETDWTLIDHAADCRAPTPTAAAEMAVPVRAQLVADITDRTRRLVACQLRLVENRRNALRAASRGLPRLADLVSLPRQRLDEAGGRLPRALIANARAHAMALARTSGRLSRGQLLRRLADCRERVIGLEQRARRAQMALTRGRTEQLDRASAALRRRRLDARLADCRQHVAMLTQRGFRALHVLRSRREEQLGRIKQLLEALSHKRVLERGFALVHDADGQLVRASAGQPSGAPLEITFAGDDRLTVRVEKPARPPSRHPRTRRGQKSLFDDD